MTLTIDTNHKTILFSGCDMAEAVHFARLHEFDGHTVKRDLPAYRVDYGQSVGETKEFIRNDLGGEYLESEVVENLITKLFILPNPESDAPKIDLDKGKKYTLEFNVNGQI